ncbi:MAG: NADH-quinone oxidoreductase subunit NuoK [Pseudomonadales bacterium]|nr:NADH-quinone oxidoreductase subunit NuoK [Pseudomonadales bacterium]
MTSAPVSMDEVMLLAGVIFTIGLVGVMVRRNILYILMSLEIALNATGLAFIGASSHWGQPDGQIMFLLILTLAAAEVSVALGLILQIHRKYNILDIDQSKLMRG